MPTAADVSHGHTRVHVEATIGEPDAVPRRAAAGDAEPEPRRRAAGALLPCEPPADVAARSDRPPGEARRRRRAGRGDGATAGCRSSARSPRSSRRACAGSSILIEEPELYLSPPAQRHLHRLLRRLAARGRNQVLYSTHSPVFLGVDRLEQLVLVRHDERTGTTLLQPEALPQRRRSACSRSSTRSEPRSSSRAPCCSSRGAPRSSRSRSSSARSATTPTRRRSRSSTAPGKGNIPLFAEICNACDIPYVVVHDRDAPRGAQPADAGADRERGDPARRRPQAHVALVPDFEGVTGLRARRGKPAAAYKRFQGGEARCPARCGRRSSASSPAARRAPRTTRGA